MSVCEVKASNAEHVKYNHMNVGPVVCKVGFLLGDSEQRRSFGLDVREVGAPGNTRAGSSLSR